MSRRNGVKKGRSDIRSNSGNIGVRQGYNSSAVEKAWIIRVIKEREGI